MDCADHYIASAFVRFYRELLAVIRPQGSAWGAYYCLNAWRSLKIRTGNGG